MFVMVALAIAVFAPAAASAAPHTNYECLLCHDSLWGINFDVGAVNKATACRKCHLDSLANTHPSHQAGANCGAQCHPGWGSSLLANTPTNVYASGSFAAPGSENSAASILHLIHANPRWQAGVTKDGVQCGSCHAAAACTSCHDNPDPSHSEHTSIDETTAVFPAWTGDLAPGVTGGDITQNTMQVSTTNTCNSSTCHDIDGIGSVAPFMLDSFVHPADAAKDMGNNSAFIKSGTWMNQSGSTFSYMKQILSNSPSAYAQYTFTGEVFVLISDRDQFRGIAEIIVDGTPIGTADLYSAVTKYQQPVYTSPELTYGTHTIRIRPTGTKNASARGSYVSVDQLRVYATAPGSVAPDCGSCHPATVPDAHGGAVHPEGGTSFSHDASQTADNLYATAYGSYRCDLCHEMRLHTEHQDRTSSSVYGIQCTSCHETYAPRTWTGAWSSGDGCNYDGCHTTTRTAHTAEAAAHTPLSDAANLECRSCHAGNLAAVHNNPFPGNGYLEDAASTCAACHTKTLYTTQKSCVSAACHVASGTQSMATHYTTGAHTATGTNLSAPMGAGGTASATCNNCHNGAIGGPSTGLVNQHTNVAAAVGSPYGTTVDCLECHDDTRSYGAVEVGTNWVARTCEACHKVGGSAPMHAAASAPVTPGTGPEGCGSTGSSCHTSNDLHGLHRNAAGGCNLTGCHDYTLQANVPTLTGCGVGSSGCHATYTNTSHAHATDATKHAPTGTQQAVDTSYYSTQCGACHDVQTNGTSLTSEHALASSARTGNANNCLNCHNHANSTTAVGNNWTAKNSTTACAACHTGGLAIHADKGSAAHSDVTSAGCSDSGVGCHNSADLSNVGATNVVNTNIHANCLKCHDRAGVATWTAAGQGNMKWNPALDTCGTGRECHSTGYNTTTYVHNTVTGADAGKHGASGMATEIATGAGDACSDCHSSALNTAHTGTTSALGSGNPAWTNTCTGCHNTNTGITSAAVVKAGWAARTCDACHVTAGPGKHDRFVPANHSATPFGANTCDEACHPMFTTFEFGDIHDETVLGCRLSGCHDVLDKGMGSAERTCGGTSTCHNGYADGSHGSATAHTFTAASDYVAATETGCTNSGSGCHGTDATYGNYGPDYHPYSGCVSGMCHAPANPSYVKLGTPRECTSCHSGTYTYAGDQIPLTGAPANGHYSETTHTATAENMSVQIGSGTAKATCANCHNATIGGAGNGYMNQHSNNGVAGSSYGPAIGCGECHNDTRSYGNAEVITASRTDQCADCHKAGGTSVFDHASSVPAVAGTGTAGCGSTGSACHSNNDLHVVHENAAGGCSLTGCHNYALQANKPVETTCGTGAAASCHPSYTNTTHAHATDATKHAPTALTQANATTYYSTACGACHDIQTSGISLTSEHALSTSAKSGNANNCLNCHNNANSATAVANNWSAKDTATACSVCHTGGLAIHADANAAAHTDVTSAGCGATGIGCHNSNDLSAVGAVTTVNTNIHASCLRCHDRTATSPNVAWNPANDTCGSGRECHGTAGQYNTSTYVHNGGTGAGLADGNDAAHHVDPSMTGTVGAGANNTCGTCHTGALANAHATTMTGWANTCTSCHNSTLGSNVSANQVKAGWSTDDCMDCHTAIGGQHSRYGTSNHNGIPAGAYTCDEACHSSYSTMDLADIHDGTANGCTATGCHAQNKAMTTADKTCGTGGACHTGHTDGNHGSATAHSFSTASNYSGATEVGCTNSGAGCHGTESGYTNYSVAQYHPIGASTCLSGGCHTSPSKGSFTGDQTEECVGCHDGAFSLAGDVVPLTGAPTNGHYSTTTHDASAENMSTQIGSGSAKATCANCHSATIGGVGNGYMNQHSNVSVSGSSYGAALGCGECHNDTRSYGQVEVTNGTLTDQCADCHKAGGTSVFDHAASVPAVAGSGTASCGSTGINCHASNDLHALHENAAGGCNLSGCHDYALQANKPTATSCGTGGGACHGAYTNTTHLHATDATKHAPSTTTQAASTTYYSTACGACHDIQSNGISLTNEHALATSAKTGNAGNNCLNCHNNANSTTAVGNNWTAQTGTTACSVCHTGGLAIHADANPAAHTDVTSAGCGATGIGCHNSNDLSAVGAVTTVNTNIHANCLRCHDRTATSPNVAWNPANDTCGSGRECHGTAGQYNTSTYVHNGGTGAGLADGNDAAHHTDTVMTGTVGAGANNTCATCHTGTLTNAHATTLTGWANTCTSCHNSTLGSNVSANQVKAGWSTNDCMDCHTAIGGQHSLYGTASHNGVPQGGNTCNEACHANSTTMDLGDIHDGVASGCTATGCHASNKAMGSAAKTCGGATGACHVNYTDTTHAHTSDVTKHAPSNTTQAVSTTFSSVACGSCHDIQSNGISLTTEHALATSAKTVNAGNNCYNCHLNAASTTAVNNNWSAQTTTGACAACHGVATLDVAHPSGVNATAHTVATNTNCGNSGAGCHPTNDLSQVGTPSTTANIHLNCLKCHDRAGVATWTTPGQGNMKYDPAKKSCGQNTTSCHSSTYYSTTTLRHKIGTGSEVTGNEANHTDTVMTGTVSTGPNNTCAACHSGGLATAHATTLTGWANTCTSCHNSTLGTSVSPTQVKNSWSTNDCMDCHTAIGGQHSRFNITNHAGVPTGVGNTCNEGCHADYTTMDLADIHDGTPNGCKTAGCHSLDTPMTSGVKGCGGTAACHTGYADGHYAVNHDSVDIWKTNFPNQDTFVWNSITYTYGKDVGCGGSQSAGSWTCHYSDLVKEHATAAAGGAGRSMDLGGVGCGVCHTDKGGTVGTGANRSGVIATIAANDMRCTSCHTGNLTTGVDAAHQGVATRTGSIVKGQGDPLNEFKAYPQTNGVDASGGHRASPANPVWPRTTFTGTVNGVTPGTLAWAGTYTGTNPRTSATWKNGDFVMCEDCHYFAAGATGPQGASVPFYFDGASASGGSPTGIAAGTHWYDSNPSKTTPAPCNKCHLTLSSAVHGKSKHAIACASCHITIPHAWKRPRLLRRITGGTLQGITQDAAPYTSATYPNGTTAYRVTAGQTSFGSSGDCVTAGCSGHSGGTPYWP